MATNKVLNLAAARTAKDEAAERESIEESLVWWWATCTACAHLWAAGIVWGYDGFIECPTCHEMKGIRTCPSPPPIEEKTP